MSERTAGTVRKLTLDGITFTLAADANFTEIFSEWENEMLATSGDGMLKKTKRTPIVEGVVIEADQGDREILKSLADSLDDFPISYQYASRGVARCTGQINIENNETDSNRTTISLLPRGVWTAYRP